MPESYMQPRSASIPEGRLLAQGADPDIVDRARAMRVIAALLADPSVSMDAADIAKRSGLLQREVITALQSDELRELLMHAARTRVAGLLGKALTHVDHLLSNPVGGVPPKLLLDALGKLTSAYASITKAEPGHDRDQSEQDFGKFLASLKTAGRIQAAPVTVANAASTAAVAAENQ